MRSWIFKCEGRGFYFLKEPIEIGDCKFEVAESEKGAKRYVGSTRIEAESIEQAIKIAKERFKRVIKALSIAVGERFEFEPLSCDEVTPQMPEDEKMHVSWGRPKLFKITIRQRFEPNMLDEAREIFPLLQKSDEYSKRALNYFTRGLTMRTIGYRSPEAYLNFFKAIELISDNFIPELKEKLKGRIEDLEDSEFKEIFGIYATRKRRIENVLEILDLNKLLKKDVGKLVKLRNEFDVAHASIEEIKLDVKDVDSCMTMAKQIIVSYLKSL